MGDQFALVGTCAIKLAAVNHLKIGFETKMINDALREDARFRGCNIEPCAPGPKFGQSLMNAGINRVFEYSLGGESLPVQINCSTNLFRTFRW